MARTIHNGHNTVASVSVKQEIPPGISSRRSRSNGRSGESLERTFLQVEKGKQEWESTIDSLPELVCLTDSRGQIIRANRTMEEWDLGQVVSVKGRPLHQLLHPQCANQDCVFGSFWLVALQKVLLNQSSEFEFEDTTLGRHLLVKVRPVVAKMTPAERTVSVVLQDVSERKALEKTLERYTGRLEVVNRIGKAVLTAHSPQDIAEAAVRHMRHLIPFQRARVTLRQPERDSLLIIDFFSNGETSRALDQWLPWKEFSGSKLRQLDDFFLVEDLTKITSPCGFESQLLDEGLHTYMSIPLVAEGEFIGSFSLGAEPVNAFQSEYVDTAVEVAHLLAIATNQALLDRKLTETNRDLQQALQARNEMIQNVSHELNNPLGIARGYAYLMKDEAFGPMTPDQASALDIVDEQLDKLDFMLNRLLILQSLDNKALRLQMISLEPLIKSLVNSWQIRATKAGITINVSLDTPLPQIEVDPDLLPHALANLLDNAIKFSPDGGDINIRSWQEENNLMVSVADQGIGIADEELELIFQRFHQADGSATRSFGGMGIGLALCKEVIDAHGGRVWAESKGTGHGSTFYLQLPINIDNESVSGAGFAD